MSFTLATSWTKLLCWRKASIVHGNKYGAVYLFSHFSLSRWSNGAMTEVLMTNINVSPYLLSIVVIQRCEVRSIA